MRLSEPYFLLMREGLYFTEGKKISKDYAICRTRNKCYTITHIETGTKVGMEYKTIKEAVEASKRAIRSVKKMKEKNRELYNQTVNKYKKKFERFIKEDKIIEDYI